MVGSLNGFESSLPTIWPSNHPTMKLSTFSILLMSLFCLMKAQVIGQTTQFATANAADELYHEIALMDKKIFTAFNHGDTATINNLFTKDLEFYHDKAGLSDFASNVRAINELTTGDIKIRRSLVKGSMKVFPVPGFGAIQEGQHDFFETLPGQPERQTGTFKFLHIWQKTDSGWKISRVVSYGH
ncbi:MAG: nuclear transport factor 2 family protein [Bacteroidota bacterium]